jgi:hypothetical protein
VLKVLKVLLEQVVHLVQAVQTDQAELLVRAV